MKLTAIQRLGKFNNRILVKTARLRTLLLLHRPHSAQYYTPNTVAASADYKIKSTNTRDIQFKLYSLYRGNLDITNDKLSLYTPANCIETLLEETSRIDSTQLYVGPGERCTARNYTTISTAIYNFDSEASRKRSLMATH